MKEYTYQTKQTVNSIVLLNKLKQIVFNEWHVELFGIAIHNNDTDFTYLLSIESKKRINKNILYGVNAYIAGAISLHKTY